MYRCSSKACHAVTKPNTVVVIVFNMWMSVFANIETVEDLALPVPHDLL